MLEIRAISVDDAKQLSAVALEAYSDHYLSYWHDDGEWYLARSFSLNNLRKEFTEKSSRFYLAIFDDRPAGFLKTRTDRCLPGFGDESGFEVERIYLTKAATGNGIGTALMNFSEQRAKEAGRDFVWLKVMDSSAGAIRFYESLGFFKCGTETLTFPQMKKELRGMYLMKKEILGN